MIPTMNYFSATISRKADAILSNPLYGGCIGALLLDIAYWFHSLWFLGFFSFVVPLLIIQRREPFNVIRAAKAGFVFGLFYFFNVFPILSFQPSFLSATVTDTLSNIILSIKFSAILMVSGLLLGLGGLLAFALAFFISRRIGLFALLSLPVFWTIAEMGFTHVAFGFQWWTIGQILVDSSILRQWAVFGGLSFLSWLLATFNILLFFIIYLRINQKQTLSNMVMALTAVFCLSIISYGYMLRQSAEAPFPLPIHLAIFQPGVTSFPRALPVTKTNEFSHYTDTISSLRPNILIIPGELVHKPIALDNINSSLIKSLIGSLAEDNNMITVITLPLKENGEIHAALVALQEKKIIGIYRKKILMPVSDYTPAGLFGSIFPSQLYGNISAFTGTNGIFLPQLHAGAFICNEVFTQKSAAAGKKSGASFLILSGNDAAFTNELVSLENLRLTQVRAVENRVWIVRAGKTGISAIINPQGDIVRTLSRAQLGLLTFP